MVKALTSRILPKALEAEMEERHRREHERKQPQRAFPEAGAITHDQEAVIAVPRDRNGSFEPAIVPKHEQRLPIFNEQIISLYVNGMTVRNI